MAKKKVVVKGGGRNLYKVSDSGGTFYVYQVIINLWGDTVNSVGQTKSFDDALSLIRSHAGKDIDKIGPW